MQYFDLHCDTLYKAVTEGLSLGNPEYEVNISSGKNFAKWCQCMALWIPDGISQQDRISLFRSAHKLLSETIETYGLKEFKDASDCQHRYIFTLENGAVLDNNLDNIKLLKNCGVKMVTLTWNDKNSIGGGAEAQEFGLSHFGKACVKELELNNIIIDVSHASDKTFYDVLDHTEKPLAASHSNSRKICSHRRNLTDEQFISIVNRNGVVGINFHKDFLNIDREKASINDVLKHTEHFLSLGGENAICIGSDFDGADPVNELSDINKIHNLYESYLKIGYNEQLVQKIMYNNAYNFFSRF